MPVGWTQREHLRDQLQTTVPRCKGHEQIQVTNVDPQENLSTNDKTNYNQIETSQNKDEFVRYK